ncbi:glucose 1-dehydrogenase [Planctomycetes bacterium TBK1r]|uniref:Glucose 1-dehydrogenase n=1 Tax=Stieleria magnilauensis TaxID=2527963 RepID=A0ABX5XW92_9BACT|nr:Glucose 1-dehydrogenase [Planctomycetes bacterium TBK1r]
MNITLDGKRTLVTGANSGIGESIAMALAESGAKVVINYVSHPEAANNIVEQIKQIGGDAMAIAADVSDPIEVAAMFERIDQAWGGIDILVNNAGIDGVSAMTWESDIDQWQKVVQINLFGAYHCAREALRRMVPNQSGVIVNMTSVHEEIAWSGYSAYTASKAALAMLTKTMAQEAAPHSIRVLSVGPGAIQTPINQSVWSDPDSMKDLLEKIPLNRIGQTEDVAKMVVVLVSHIASYVTGRTIFIDGGMTDYPNFSHGG